jgi:hypothetical protein
VVRRLRAAYEALELRLSADMPQPVHAQRESPLQQAADQGVEAALTRPDPMGPG